MIIDRLPRFVRAFFDPLRSLLHRPQFQHLWQMVMALLICTRRPNLSTLARVIPDLHHRTSHGHFLTHADWDAPAVLEAAGKHLLTRMRPRKREEIYLLIDDTRIAKRGRRMFAVTKIWDHAQHRFVYGHIVVTGAVLFRGVVWPWRFELWVPRRHAGSQYRKMTEIAAEMIRAFQPPPHLKVRVLFDAFYLCPTVTQACAARGFTWFSVAAKGRRLQPAGRKAKRLGALGIGLLKHEGRQIRMPRSRGRARLRIAAVAGTLARIGPVKVVFSKRPGQPGKHMVAFTTNETGLDARTIVSVYERRWSIELLFKELRSDLGLGDYQVLARTAIQKHLHLCGLAHLLLTHHSMEAVGAQARKANTPPALPRFRERLDDFRRAVRNEQLRGIFRGERHAKLRRKLDRYLQAA